MPNSASMVLAVLHSGATRTPLWSAEVMSAAGVAFAQKAKRFGDFHTEAAPERGGRDPAGLRLLGLRPGAHDPGLGLRGEAG